MTEDLIKGYAKSTTTLRVYTINGRNVHAQSWRGTLRYGVKSSSMTSKILSREGQTTH